MLMNDCRLVMIMKKKSLLKVLFLKLDLCFVFILTFDSSAFGLVHASHLPLTSVFERSDLSTDSFISYKKIISQ